VQKYNLFPFRQALFLKIFQKYCISLIYKQKKLSKQENLREIVTLLI